MYFNICYTFITVLETSINLFSSCRATKKFIIKDGASETELEKKFAGLYWGWGQSPAMLVQTPV